MKIATLVIIFTNGNRFEFPSAMTRTDALRIADLFAPDGRRMLAGYYLKPAGLKP